MLALGGGGGIVSCLGTTLPPGTAWPDTSDYKAWLRARGVGQPIGCFTEPAPDDLSALDALARTYVVCEGDPGDPPVAPGTPVTFRP